MLLFKTAPSSFYKGYTAVLMAMGEPHDEQKTNKTATKRALILT